MNEQTALTVQAPQVVTHSNGKTEALDHFVRRVMFPGVTDDTLALTLFMCQRYQLDPLLKHVVVIKFGGKDAPYITRDGLLFIAHRTNLLDGMEVTYGNDQDGMYAECTVWRKDCNHPFRFRAYRADYDTKRNVWQSNPRAMTQKTAECMALKRAFNIDMTALEEMDGAIERDGGEVVQGVAFVTDEDHIVPSAADLERKLNGDPKAEPPPAPKAPVLPSERPALVAALAKAHNYKADVITASLKKYEAEGSLNAADGDEAVKAFVAVKIAAKNKGNGPVIRLQSRTEPILALDALRSAVTSCIEANRGWIGVPAEKRQIKDIAIKIAALVPLAVTTEEKDDVRHGIVGFFFNKPGASALDKAEAAALLYWLTDSDDNEHPAVVDEVSEILNLLEELDENTERLARAIMEPGEDLFG